MKTFMPLAAILAAITPILAVPALAHPHLVRAAPAEASTSSNIRRIDLTFNEPLIARLSSVDVVMTAMPGMANVGHQRPMKINGVRVSVAPDGKTLTAALTRPLPAGSYNANWHAVSTDTHRVAGRVSFRVR